MSCSARKHDVALLSFSIAMQKNEANLSPFVQFENEMASYHPV